jgi:hypothetical protein
LPFAQAAKRRKEKIVPVQRVQDKQQVTLGELWRSWIGGVSDEAADTNHSGVSAYLKAARALAPELPHGVHELHEDVGHVPPDLALLGLLLAVRLLPALAEVMRCVPRKPNTVLSMQSCAQHVVL